MALHLIFSVSSWQACQPYLQDEDVVILIGEGVYARPETPHYVLDPDLSIRGVQATSSATCIDYAELIRLTESHHPAVSWNE